MQRYWEKLCLKHKSFDDFCYEIEICIMKIQDYKTVLQNADYTDNDNKEIDNKNIKPFDLKKSFKHFEKCF